MSSDAGLAPSTVGASQDFVGPTMRIDAAHGLASKAEQPHAAPPQHGQQGGPFVAVQEPRGVVLDSAEPPSAELLDTLSGQAGGRLAEQLRRQALELSQHLLQRQQGLDHREAEVNSRVALLEQELRTTRLVIQDREAALMALEQELRARHEAVKQQAADVVSAQATVDEARIASGPSKGSVGADSPVVPRRAGSASIAKPMDTSDPQTAERNRLREQLAELEKRRQWIEQERHQLLARAEQERQSVAEERRSLEALLRRKKLALARSQQGLKQRQALLKRLHRDVTDMHREALELRLCTEELWLEINRPGAPYDPNQRLAQLRQRLDHHYQQAQNGLALERQELDRLQAKIEDRERDMQRHRRGLQQLWSRQQVSVDQQMAACSVQQRQLDLQRDELQRLVTQWDAERREYQEEIRRLMELNLSR